MHQLYARFVLNLNLNLNRCTESAGLWLSLGGFQEASPDGDRLFNSHVVLDSSGETAAAYRKIHLFDVDVPGGPMLLESRSTAPGTKVSNGIVMHLWLLEKIAPLPAN